MYRKLFKDYLVFINSPVATAIVRSGVAHRYIEIAGCTTISTVVKDYSSSYVNGRNSIRCGAHNIILCVQIPTATRTVGLGPGTAAIGVA